MQVNKSKTDVSWQEMLSGSVVSANQLQSHIPISAETVEPVVKRYPMRINTYFLALVKKYGEPIARQVIPDLRELEENGFTQDDPFAEITRSPVENLVHRYADRVLLAVSGQCAIYCRYCMRKRDAGIKGAISPAHVEQAVKYIEKTPNIREVILSGGDPLLLKDDFLEFILFQLKNISHVKYLRIHTRVPCVLPMRITGKLAELLRRFHPLYVNVQFNHPAELTNEAAKACEMLADAGIALGSQTVLLKGVNDDPVVMAGLMEKLLASRVRPYYLHHPDPVRGTAHFRVSPEKGLLIMKALRKNLSGMGIPQYVMDLPGGGGKVPVAERHAGRHAGIRPRGKL